MSTRVPPEGAFELQAAAHHFAQGAADHQPQPGTLPTRLLTIAGLHEGTEQALLIEGADADTAVLHLHTDRQTLR
jgi:hypothetical protein